MLPSEGQMSDFKGAALMLDALPRAKALLGDKGFDADWFRAALANRGIAACIPSKANRKVQFPHDRTLYRQHTGSRTCSANSRIGAESTPATTAAPTPLCLPSASPQPSSSGSINES
jgi:IS5 family transposase